MKHLRTHLRTIKITAPAVMILLFAAASAGALDYSGSLETTAYTYSTESEELQDTETNSKIYEKILFDLDIAEDIRFHINNRVAYRTDKNEDPEQWDFNLYYGFVDYKITEDLKAQAGRIMEIDSIIYSFYDGANIKYSHNISKHRLNYELYGGLIVNDDYLEDENEIYGFNSFDYRNLYIEQRHGDYLAGIKTGWFSSGLGIVNLDYQMNYNEGSLTEHYLSLDFSTLFSDKLLFYGYGTFDLIDKTPANSLAAGQYNPADILSIIIEHEYYRPVYLKDSFFWYYFEPYGNQQLSGLFIFYLTRLMTFDIKYGKIFYDSSSETGDEASCNFEHRRILEFDIKLSGEYLNGPEGDKITGQCLLQRRVKGFDISGGGGVVYYKEDDISDTYSNGYFGTLGIDTHILHNLVMSADGEYYNNPKYFYDIRGIVSVEFLF